MKKIIFSSKIIGLIILIASILLSIVIYIHIKDIINMGKELHKDCPLPDNVCPYKRSIPAESTMGLVIISGFALFGLYLIFNDIDSKKESIIESEKIKEAAKSLEGEEKLVYEKIKESDGYIFQNDLIAKTNFSKVKITRVLDKLETKNIVERRRRGMSNVVVLR